MNLLHTLWWYWYYQKLLMCSFYNSTSLGLPRWCSGKESTSQCRRLRKCTFRPWVRKISWRGKRQPTPVFLTGEIPRTEKHGGLESLGLQRVGRDWARTLTHSPQYWDFYKVCKSHDIDLHGSLVLPVLW